MAKRLISCDFINASAFKVKLSNKAKLMYLYLITNGDDMGFVANALETAKILQNVETDNNGLVETTYEDSIEELVKSGHIFRFTDKHQNDIILVRHWFYHNKLVKGLETNYKSLLKQVELIDNEWQIRKKPLKENKINKSKEINVNNEKEKSFEEIIEDLENLGEQE